MPVPLGAGEESADPEAAGALRGEAPVLVDAHPVAHVDGDLAQGVALHVREHEIVPVPRRLDPLREVVEPWPSLLARDVPQRRSCRGVTAGERLVAGCDDGLPVERELDRDRLDLPGERVRRRPERGTPERRPLVQSQGGHDHTRNRVCTDLRRLEAGEDDRRPHTLEEPDCDSGRLSDILVLPLHDERSGAEDSFALPETRQSVALGCRRWHVRRT